MLSQIIPLAEPHDHDHPKKYSTFSQRLTFWDESEELSRHDSEEFEESEIVTNHNEVFEEHEVVAEQEDRNCGKHRAASC